MKNIYNCIDNTSIRNVFIDEISMLILNDFH